MSVMFRTSTLSKARAASDNLIRLCKAAIVASHNLMIPGRRAATGGPAGRGLNFTAQRGTVWKHAYEDAEIASHQGYADTRGGYGLCTGPNRTFDEKDQRADRSFEEERKGQAFAPRPLADGGGPTLAFEVPRIERQARIQQDRQESGIEEVTKNRPCVGFSLRYTRSMGGPETGTHVNYVRVFSYGYHQT